MLRVRLPYPDRDLSPNARKIWQVSMKPKKAAREIGYHAARKLSIYHGQYVYQYCDKPLRLRIAIHPPDNRRRDYINAVSAIKFYEDGIMDYIGIDDSKIKHIDIRWRRSCPGGKVRYILYQK